MDTHTHFSPQYILFCVLFLCHSTLCEFHLNLYIYNNNLWNVIYNYNYMLYEYTLAYFYSFYSFHGHLGCFQFRSITNIAAIKILHTSFGEQTHFCFEYVIHMFSFSTFYQIAFQSGYINWHLQAIWVYQLFYTFTCFNLLILFLILLIQVSVWSTSL